MKAKTKQKRLLSLLLVLMMTLTLLPATAFASGDIISVDIFDVTLPKGNQQPSYHSYFYLTGSTGTSGNVSCHYASADELLDFGWPKSDISRYTNGKCWWDGSGNTAACLGPSDPFVPGNSYMFEVVLVPTNGCNFANSASIKINGNAENVQSAYIYRGCLVVKSIYWKATTPITSVDISGIDLPVEGAAPDYSGTLPADAPYRFATTEEMSIRGYNWNAQNGIYWGRMPVETFGESTPNPYFLAMLFPNKGYSFPTSPSEITATINGTSDQVNYVSCYGDHIAVVSIDYPPITLTPITHVDISDITMPVAGATPDYTGTLPANAPYRFATTEELLDTWPIHDPNQHQNGLAWAGMSPTDTFTAGDTTYLKVYLVAEDGYKFADDLTVSINGSTELGDQDFTPTKRNQCVVFSVDIKVPGAAASIPAGYNGIYNLDGHFYYCENGAVNTSYRGLAPYGDTYWFVENGEIDFTYTDLATFNGAEYFVYGGQLITTTDGLFNIGTAAKSPNSGGWVLFQQGRYASDYTGLVYYYGKYYYVKDGEVDWTYYDFADLDGVPYLVISGMMYSNIHGLYDVNGTWVLVTYNRLYSEYTGYFAYGGNEYYIQNGYLDWSVPVRTA